ncbi:MAG: glycosyltransferase, partial [Bacillota bacterium]
MVKTRLIKGDMVEYTGERFIPGSDNDKETEIEHLQRYYSLKDIIRDKIVVDAACGEGYGSMFMAGYALKVIGIDISEETIKQAKEKYKKDNLDFICASISKMPVKDKTADIIVSFETIEHVDSQAQNDFMLEAQRALKEDGLLIISTPNKEIYSDLFDYRNPFHVKEFGRSEFHQFLSNYFKYIKMFHQRYEVVSLLNNGKESSIDVLDIIENPDNAKYMVAICSNREINVSIGSIVYDNQYLNLKKRIIEIQNEIEKLSAWGKWQDEEIARRDSTIVSQNAWIEELSAWGKKQEKEIAEKDETISLLNKKIEELASWGKQLDKENHRKDDAISSLNEQIEGYNDTLKQLETRIQEKEEELKKIYNSRGWKLLLALYKIENRIIPLHSRRREALKVIYFLLRNLKLVVRHINLENLKKLFKYARTENPRRIFGRIKNYFNRFKPIPPMELKLFEKAGSYEKISFKPSSEPLVSIIIPVYNKWEYTYLCLRSIRENTESIEYEIILADDVSSDETVNIGQYIENIKVVRNTENLGFLRNCNNAAKHARGKYILFLNNDTNVQKDWLNYLVDLAEKDDTI